MILFVSARLSYIGANKLVPDLVEIRFRIPFHADLKLRCGSKEQEKNLAVSEEGASVALLPSCL